MILNTVTTLRPILFAGGKYTEESVDYMLKLKILLN